MKATFREKLQDFVRRQRNQSAHDVQQNAHDFSQQVQEYAPKERWGNIFKYIVAYALGIGLGHAVAAALTRGVDELALPSGMDPDTLASEIEAGNITDVNFDVFMDEIGVHDPDFSSLEHYMSGFEDPTDTGVEAIDAGLSEETGMPESDISEDDLDSFLNFES